MIQINFRQLRNWNLDFANMGDDPAKYEIPNYYYVCMINLVGSVQNK